jgi:hypothetical protein
MSRESLLLAPESLDALLAAIGDLGAALGPESATGLAAVRQLLEQAKTARDDGATDRAVHTITIAMQKLAELASALDPQEAAAMQAMTGAFRTALGRGDAARAAESVDQMRVRSGAVKRRGDENKL